MGNIIRQEGDIVYLPCPDTPEEVIDVSLLTVKKLLEATIEWKVKNDPITEGDIHDLNKHLINNLGDAARLPDGTKNPEFRKTNREAAQAWADSKEIPFVVINKAGPAPPDHQEHLYAGVHGVLIEDGRAPLLVGLKTAGTGRGKDSHRIYHALVEVADALASEKSHSIGHVEPEYHVHVVDADKVNGAGGGGAGGGR